MRSRKNKNTKITPCHVIHVFFFANKPHEKYVSLFTKTLNNDRILHKVEKNYFNIKKQREYIFNVDKIMSVASKVLIISRYKT